MTSCPCSPRFFYDILYVSTFFVWPLLLTTHIHKHTCRSAQKLFESLGHWVCLSLEKKFTLSETKIKKKTWLKHTGILCFSFMCKFVDVSPYMIKSQSQVGVIRRLPSGSHKRRQLRAACFTNMRCIVVIKEPLEYRHRIICKMFLLTPSQLSSAHTYEGRNMLKLKIITRNMNTHTADVIAFPVL